MPAKPAPPAPVKLPADIRAQLEAQGEAMPDLRKQLAALKELGVDVKEIEERLDWADNARKVLLSEF